jgi:hypothetical protein
MMGQMLSTVLFAGAGRLTQPNRRISILPRTNLIGVEPKLFPSRGLALVPTLRAIKSATISGRRTRIIPKPTRFCPSDTSEHAKSAAKTLHYCTHDGERRPRTKRLYFLDVSVGAFRRRRTARRTVTSRSCCSGPMGDTQHLHAKHPSLRICRVLNLGSRPIVIHANSPARAFVETQPPSTVISAPVM